MPSPRPQDDVALLEKLVLGRLPVAEAERLAVEYADDRRLVDLAEAVSRGNDTLLESLKQHETVNDSQADGLVARLIARLKAKDSSDLGETVGVDQTAPVDGEAIPESLEYFRIRKLLGQGGMGRVFLADDTRLGRPVALKTLKRELAANPVAKDRFLREARSAARLEHDHIIPIYYVGESDGTPFLAMPFLQGEPLDARLRREGNHDPDPANQFARLAGQSKPLPVTEAARIGYQVALGLAVAHAQGLIHRDIKPANVWLEAPSGRVKILDFGLARSQSEKAQLTVSGTIMGTPAYMAPEQARGKPVDGRADLFSLGVMLYEMTTGRRPFTGDDTMAILSSLALDEPTPPSQLNDNLPCEFSDLILRLLSKSPEQRPGDAGRVAEALLAFGLTEVQRTPRAVPAARGGKSGKVARPASPTPSKTARPHPVKRRSMPVTIVAAALLLVGGGFAAYKLMFETKEGTLIVEVDGDADVRFKSGEVQVFDEEGKQKYTLRPGQRDRSVAPGRYTVSVVGADGVRLDTDQFEMTKSGRVHIRVTAAAPAVVRKSDDAPISANVTDHALALDGLGAYVETPVHYDGTHPLTIEATVRFDGRLKDPRAVVSNLDLPVRPAGGASLHFGQEGWAFSSSRRGAEPRVDSRSVISQKYVQLAGVWDGQAVKLFVDGKLVAGTTASIDWKFSEKKLSFLIGSELEGGRPHWFFPGRIDEVRISKVARYTSDYLPKPRFEPDADTMALYHCDEGWGDRLIDASANQLHGRVIGAQWVERNAKSDATAWLSFFNGKDLTGWEAIPRDGLKGWTVVDGVLHGSGNKSNIATTAEFADFEMELEWRLTKGANGGVFYRWGGEHQLTADDGPCLHAPEYQIVDNKEHPNGKVLQRTNGAVYGMYAPTGDTTVAPGAWHKSRIVARGNRIEHWLNDRMVVECEIDSPDWKKRLEQWRNNPADGKARKGRIALQSHTGEVDYRNIRIRAIDPQPVTGSKPK